MLNKSFFKKIKKEAALMESERRQIITRSNEALHKSKRAIFMLHRDEPKEAAKLLKEIEATFLNLEKKFKLKAKLRYEGSYRAASEEYTEAKLFYNFLDTYKIDKIKEVPTQYDVYIGGLCDFTGELIRRAVRLATEGNFKEVKKIKEAIEQVMKELIEMNLTGYLRTKYDQAKNNLRKIEGILYDISLKKK